MSQQQQIQQTENTSQKSTKTKQQIEKQKALTNAWHKKQEEKKKKKLQQQQEQNTVQLDEKALQKAKRKQQKRLEREQMLKEQGLSKQGQIIGKPVVQSKKQQIKQQQNKNIDEKKKPQENKSANKDIHGQRKKNAKKDGDSSTKIQQPTPSPIRKASKDKVLIPTTPKPVYTQLMTLEQHLGKSSPSAASSIGKPQKTQLIYKYLDQYVNQNDTILVLSRADSWHPLTSRCGRRVFLYPIHEEYEKCQQCENIVCTYEDVAYLMDGTLTKIFVQLDVVFANGTALTQKGHQNIIVMANEFKIPVIGYSGTWNFNAWNFLSREMFLNKYGDSHVEKYDILENDQFEIIVLEIGSVIPKQISVHLENLSKIYRGFDIHSLKW